MDIGTEQEIISFAGTATVTGILDYLQWINSGYTVRRGIIKYTCASIAQANFKGIILLLVGESMERTKWKRSYSLSQRDLTVMGQAKVSLSEVVGQTQIARHLPPLWSTMSYVMLFYPDKPPAAFWKKYRELIDLADHREKFYDKAYRPKRTSGTRTLLVPKYEIRRHQKFILRYSFSLPLVSILRYSTLRFCLIYRKCRCPRTPIGCCSSSGSIKQGM